VFEFGDPVRVDHEKTGWASILGAVSIAPVRSAAATGARVVLRVVDRGIARLEVGFIGVERALDRDRGRRAGCAITAARQLLRQVLRSKKVRTVSPASA
jgi:hypothetical protein